VSDAESARAFYLDETDRPRSVIQVLGDEKKDVFSVAIFNASGTGTITGKRTELALRLHRVLDVLSPPPHAEPPPLLPVSLDTLRAHRVEIGKLFIAELKRLGAGPKAVAGLANVLDRLNTEK
jgi:hypothetical protein